MKNNEALKKHHFWILAGLAPLFVLLAVIFMMTGVSSAISKQQEEIKKDIDTVTKTSPPGEGALAELAKQKVVLDQKKGELWKENWERQKTFFTWPRAPRNEFDKYKDLKFGAPLVNNINEFEVFTKNYPDLYPELAKRVAPTRFAGTWQSVLRYVPDWGQLTPRSEQIWLALEDLWVQRAVLEPIKVVNDEISTFELVSDPQSTPLKRKFKSRLWELTLEVADPPMNAPAGAGKVLKGKLKNRTGQLQLLGLGNTMRLNVWFDKNVNVPAFWFDVQGEFVAGGAEVDVPPLFTHFLFNYAPTEITKVTQQLDERTVPVRRIDRVVLGYPSSKHATKELQTPKFWPEEAAAPAVTPGGGDTGAGPGATGSADGGIGATMPGGPGGPGGFGARGGAAGGPAAVLDANRRRYLEVTDQVRRMPVALVLVVDQMFIPDVLVAYSNSPFRFFTVQTHWRRFHGSLGTTQGGVAAGGPMMGGPMMGGPSMGGMTGSPDGGDEGPGAMGFAGEGLHGGYGGGMQSPYGGFGGGSNTVSEAQANAGLVELTIYGVVSLYEKYEEKKDETAAPAEAPKADEKKADTPDPKAGDTPPAPDAGKPATDPAAPMPKGDEKKAADPPAAAPTPKDKEKEPAAPPAPSGNPKT